MLGHGSGGTMMKRIIDEVFFAAYAGEELRRGDDAAVLDFGAAADACALAPGERLARLLTEGDEFALACEAVRLEQIIKGGDRLQELLAVTEEALSRLLPVHPRRAAKALRAVKTCRENGVYNPGAGHTLGWLITEASEPL